MSARHAARVAAHDRTAGAIPARGRAAQCWLPGGNPVGRTVRLGPHGRPHRRRVPVFQVEAPDDTAVAVPVVAVRDGFPRPGGPSDLTGVRCTNQKSHTGDRPGARPCHRADRASPRGEAVPCWLSVLGLVGLILMTAVLAGGTAPPGPSGTRTQPAGAPVLQTVPTTTLPTTPTTSSSQLGAAVGGVGCCSAPFDHPVHRRPAPDDHHRADNGRAGPDDRRLRLRLRGPTDRQRRRPTVAVHLRRRVQRDRAGHEQMGRSSRRPTGATTRGWNASRTARATSRCRGAP